MEFLESAEDFERAILTEPNPVTGIPTADSLTEDLDLVIVQGSDNINTPQREEAFRRTCGMFVQLIKQRSPRARIIWVFGWYNKKKSLAPIREVCRRWSIEAVDLFPLKSEENQAAKGQAYVKEEGSTAIALDGWITHPGNLGMKKIANKILEKIGLE